MAKTDYVVLVLHEPGKYKIAVWLFNGKSKIKYFNVKPHKYNIEKTLKDSNNSSYDEEQSHDTNESKYIGFGKGDIVGNNSMAADIPHNYSGMQQFVIVNYTVSSI